MAQNNDAMTERTDNQKIEMAEHFVEFEAEYRTEPDNHEIVYEDDQVIVVADHTGFELNEWSSFFAVDRREFSSLMHELAKEVCDYNWSTADPIVFDKLESDE